MIEDDTFLFGKAEEAIHQPPRLPGVRYRPSEFG
ncbi:hypothetical protein E2C01_087629 [Portunus trituberculatus]|uniref:Uncharacterized protein n=1 Tax=Portunus trituberculatus TaxID=210409 RepID=A0A5B7JEK4_PORTR|nr:hypothetical protein [Portunus trituberculatus]